MCLFTSHADTHHGQHGAYDNCQENKQNNQVGAEQGSTRTVQLPPMHEIQRQTSDPSVDKEESGFIKQEYEEIKEVNILQRKGKVQCGM